VVNVEVLQFCQSDIHDEACIAECLISLKADNSACNDTPMVALLFDAVERELARSASLAIVDSSKYRSPLELSTSVNQRCRGPAFLRIA